MKLQEKLQLIQEFQNFVTSDEVTDVDIRLSQLVEQQRITESAAYYTHSSYSWHPVKQMEAYISRASKAKDFFQYLKSGWTLWELNYYLNDAKRRHAAALKFVQEQEELPFEETQKQVLIKEGELQQAE